MFTKALLFAGLTLLVVNAQSVTNQVVPKDLTVEEKLEELKDIVVSGNTVGGDINVLGGGGGQGHGGEEHGFGEGEGETFDDGCQVSGDMVQECDGTSRLMTKVEKKKVTARIARRKRTRQQGGAKRTARNKKTRRDLEDGAEGGEEGGMGEESPCQTCSTGASYARKNARKNNARKNNARKNNARKA